MNDQMIGNDWKVITQQSCVLLTLVLLWVYIQYNHE